MVRLVTSDNVEFVVDKEVVERSTLIKDFASEDVGESIPLANVSSVVIEYCEHYRGEPLPSADADQTSRRITDISAWDQDFITNMIRGKTHDEICRLFNIVHDFTPEEEAQINKENEWAEDR
ncbi:hypothetical protein BDR04DRAFT_1134296 [Suillus decipiens]|nr:hypothetical protein BDR04DRAFT_1134296 [Suillus decipiens]